MQFYEWLEIRRPEAHFPLILSLYSLYVLAKIDAMINWQVLGSLHCSQPNFYWRIVLTISLHLIYKRIHLYCDSILCFIFETAITLDTFVGSTKLSMQQPKILCSTTQIFLNVYEKTGNCINHFATCLSDWL